MRRLHPALYCVELVQLLVPAACFFTAFLLVRIVGGRAWSMIAVITFYCCYSLYWATHRLRNSGYEIAGADLLIRAGATSRAARVIPIRDLEAIEIRQTGMHRRLGIAEVRLVTRNEGDDDVLLSFVGRAAADQLRRQLLQQNPALAVAEQAPARAAGMPLWSARLRDLVLHGITENRAGVILFIVYLIGQVVRGQSSTPVRPLEILLAALFGWNTLAITLKIIIAVIVLFLVGFLFSTALTIAEFHPYRLYRKGREIRRRYGHLTGHEWTTTIDRIQALRIEAVPIRQWIGVWNIEAITAGDPRTGRKGRSNPLLLLTRQRELADHCRLIYPDLNLDQVTLQRADRLCVRRWFVPYALPGLLAALLAGWLVHGSLYFAAPLWIFTIALIAWIRYQVIGYAETPAHLIAQAGVWTRNRFVLPYHNIQYVELRESGAQRRLGLAGLVVGFAGSGKYAQATIPDIPRAEAAALRERLLNRVQATGAWH